MAQDSQASNMSGWRTGQVYTMAAICLALGLALGYLFRGSKAAPPTPAVDPTTQTSTQPPAMHGMQQMPTLEQMKQMADTKAAPLLAQLKNDPSNAGLLIQVAHIYESTHQFKEAAGYFDKSLAIDPKSVATRTEMASALYYSGDVDGALKQLQTSLTYDPKDAETLFNLGMIRWRGKQDTQGAVAAWEKLLKLNPTLAEDKKSQVQKLIADAQKAQP